jgi:hypothetical protein
MKNFVFVLVLMLMYTNVDSQILNNFNVLNKIEVNDIEEARELKIGNDLLVYGIDIEDSKLLKIKRYNKNLELIDTKSIQLSKKGSVTGGNLLSNGTIEIYLVKFINQGKVILNSKLEVLFNEFWPCGTTINEETKPFLSGAGILPGYNHQQKSCLYENNMCYDVIYANNSTTIQAKSNKSKIICYKQSKDIQVCNKLWEYDLSKLGTIVASTISNKIDSTIFFIINSTRNNKNIETLLSFEKQTGKLVFSLEININNSKDFGTLISKIKVGKNDNELFIAGNYFKQSNYKKIEDYYKKPSLDGTFILKIDKRGNILKTFYQEFKPIEVKNFNNSKLNNRAAICNVLDMDEDENIYAVFGTIFPFTSDKLLSENIDPVDGNYNYTHYSYLKLSKEFTKLEENTFPYKLIYNKKKEFLLGDKLINSGIPWTFVIRDFFKPNQFSADEMLQHRVMIGGINNISFDVKYRLPNCFYDELVSSNYNTNAEGMGGTPGNLYSGNENPIISIAHDNSMLVFSGIGIAKVTSINNSNYKYDIKYALEVELDGVSSDVIKKFGRFTIQRDEKSIYFIRNTNKGIEISIVEW